MAQLEAAIDSYHAAYGFYPPGNQLNAANGVINQLYYELVGVDHTNGAFPDLGWSARQSPARTRRQSLAWADS